MNINKVMLFGNLTKDPELKQLPCGSVVCNISIATNRDWKDKDGNKQSQVTFHNLTAWGKQGEAIAQYMKKGDNAFFEGRMENNDYEKDGVKHYQMKMTVENFMFGINKKKEGSSDNDGANAVEDEGVEDDPFGDL